MRLGDLDALKIVIRDNPYLMENLNDNNFECVLDLIDNAPTVEPETTRLALINDIRKKQMAADKAFLEGYEEGKTKRPQGEWIETDTLWEDNCGGGMGYDYGYYFKCSACDKRVVDKTNFCPYCGAAMQNGGKEE